MSAAGAELSKEELEARDELIKVVESLESCDREGILGQAIADSTPPAPFVWADIKQQVLQRQYKGWESFVASVEIIHAELQAVDNKKVKLKKSCQNLSRNLRRQLQTEEKTARKALHQWHPGGKEKAEAVRFNFLAFH